MLSVKCKIKSNVAQQLYRRFGIALFRQVSVNIRFSTGFWVLYYVQIHTIYCLHGHLAFTVLKEWNNYN